MPGLKVPQTTVWTKQIIFEKIIQPQKFGVGAEWKFIFSWKKKLQWWHNYVKDLAQNVHNIYTRVSWLTNNKDLWLNSRTILISVLSMLSMCHHWPQKLGSCHVFWQNGWETYSFICLSRYCQTNEGAGSESVWRAGELTFASYR